MSVIGQRQLFLDHVAQTSEGPLLLEVEKASGVYLYGPDGKKTFDLISGISVSNLGHSHPAVVAAVKQQADSYMHLMVYGELVQAPQVQLAEKLTSKLPENLNSVFFVNSGSEATEGALKLAKRYTGRSKIVACKKAYHGSTHGALSVLGDEFFKQAYRPLLPDIHFMEFNKQEALDCIDDHTAAVIVETVQGEAGVVVPSIEYMQALRQKCNETGALLIFDEVQTGFGRTGKLFGFEHFGVAPDIVNFAKGLGGGMPLGAFVSAKKIMHTLTHNPILGHITTFGGHPVSCAASLAMLTVLEDSPELIASAEAKGQLFKQALQSHPLVKNMWGIGLLLAVEFESSALREKIMRRLLDEGVMLDLFLFREDCLRIAPPLVITEDEINEACSIIISVFNHFIK